MKFACRYYCDLSDPFGNGNFHGIQCRRFRVSCQTCRGAADRYASPHQPVERVVAHINPDKSSALSFFVSSTCWRTLRASSGRVLQFCARRVTAFGGITSRDNTIVTTSLPWNELTQVAFSPTIITNDHQKRISLETRNIFFSRKYLSKFYLSPRFDLTPSSRARRRYRAANLDSRHRRERV